ncbi:hypothetical protein AnaeK_3928 [Anaeromyxobacter sp. K]|nr:hypothetical protein AnaeK_3928 [Anaeromyxobacter sp. K]
MPIVAAAAIAPLVDLRASSKIFAKRGPTSSSGNVLTSSSGTEATPAASRPFNAAPVSSSAVESVSRTRLRQRSQSSQPTSRSGSPSSLATAEALTRAASESTAMARVSPSATLARSARIDSRRWSAPFGVSPSEDGTRSPQRLLISSSRAPAAEGASSAREARMTAWRRAISSRSASSLLDVPPSAGRDGAAVGGEVEGSSADLGLGGGAGIGPPSADRIRSWLCPATLISRGASTSSGCSHVARIPRSDSVARCTASHAPSALLRDAEASSDFAEAGNDAVCTASVARRNSDLTAQAADDATSSAPTIVAASAAASGMIARNSAAASCVEAGGPMTSPSSTAIARARKIPISATAASTSLEILSLPLSANGIRAVSVVVAGASTDPTTCTSCSDLPPGLRAGGSTA